MTTHKNTGTLIVTLLVLLAIATSIGYGYQKILIHKDFVVFTEDQSPSSYLPFTIGS